MKKYHFALLYRLSSQRSYRQIDFLKKKKSKREKNIGYLNKNYIDKNNDLKFNYFITYGWI